MTYAAPIASSATARPSVDTHTSAAAQLDALYGTTDGIAFLSWIDGDPRPNCGGIYDQQTYHWPRQRRLLLDHAANLSARGLNVYVGLCLHNTPQRTYGSALPSPWLWSDDYSTLPDDASMAVETSAGNYQVYWRLDAPLDARTRSALQRRARKANAADPTSADAVKLVRLAGGHNRKRHGDFTVRMERPFGGLVHQVETLAAQWPAAQTNEAQPIDLDRSAIEQWTGNLGALLVEGLPRRWKPETYTKNPGWRVLRASMFAHDRSTARYIVLKSLLLHGYSNDETTALGVALADFGHSREKGSDWLYNDIARCIPKIEAELVQEGRTRRISATLLHPSAPAQPLPEIERPRRQGRPSGTQKLTPARLFTWCQEQAGLSDVLLLTRAEVAQQLGVSVPTIQRCERVLVAQGLIERRFFNRRQSSMIVLLTSDQKLESAPISTYVHVRSSQGSQAHQDAESVSAPAMEEHIQPAALPSAPAAAAPATRGLCSPALAPVDARAAVVDAFDAAGPGVVLTRKRIERYLASNYPDLVLAPSRLSVLITEERARRRVARLRTVEQQRIAALTEKQLRAQIASAQRHIANGLRMQPLDQPDDTPADSAKRRALWQRDRTQLVFWQHRHQALSAQLARLIDVALARFDRAALATEHQERLLLDWLDMQRAPMPRAPRTSVAVHVEPVENRIQPDILPAIATAAGLIARLRERREKPTTPWYAMHTTVSV